MSSDPKPTTSDHLPEVAKQRQRRKRPPLSAAERERRMATAGYFGMNGHRVCAICKIEKKPEEFARNRNNASGYASYCLACKDIAAKEFIERKKERRVRELDALALKQIEIFAKASQVQEVAAKLPHMTELYQSIMEVLGGPEMLAAHWMANYTAATPGGDVRRRMLSDLVGLGKDVSVAGHSQVPDEFRTDEDLRREALLLQQSGQIRIANTEAGNAKTA